ncbi:Peptidyl-prolyl cis-trans isomerase FKBP53 [Arabidopsis thaliana]|uniref:FK506-binding protein n=3 Tax=Arabidopsis TaxID=3701 RepID=A0A178V311_ARATH|nr:FKBP53 [Arabidopsis thaliana]CAA0396451.1 unnamed protein product [Arabidopsis thaliana]VYS63864.1 unnamed protein product [Arabidopsis thaliana]
MGFWGLEVKPGKPQAYNPKNEQGKIHVTQATLGTGLSKEKSVIQCSIGDKAPIALCSLLPNKIECCPLNLEFDDDDEPVEFTVTGDRSIHLSGFLEYYQDDEDDYEHDEDDSDGIDVGESEEDDSCEYDSEEDEQLDEFEDFLDSNLERYRNAAAPKSGVIIEEIEDEEKPAKDNKAKQTKKKSQASEGENAKKQIVAIEGAHVPVLESEDEDEDGLPIPKGKSSEVENASGEKMVVDNDEQGSNKKRKAKAAEQDDGQESANKSKKKKNQKEKKKGENVLNEEAGQVQTGNVLKKQDISQISSNTKAQDGTANNAMSESSKTPDKSAEKKTKNKKKKKPSEEAAEISGTVEKQTPADSKSSQVRTYPNGLIVEELSMGKPNGKRADPGKTVSVRYIGKLQKNGKIFDSNIGKSPFKFRLGIGSVIKGWDVGVNGMRVGDKRKLTIPPSMGYGAKGAGGQIPPNAWLTFDVELINVQ